MPFSPCNFYPVTSGYSSMECLLGQITSISCTGTSVPGMWPSQCFQFFHCLVEKWWLVCFVNQRIVVDRKERRVTIVIHKITHKDSKHSTEEYVYNLLIHYTCKVGDFYPVTEAIDLISFQNHHPGPIPSLFKPLLLIVQQGMFLSRKQNPSPTGNYCP